MPGVFPQPEPHNAPFVDAEARTCIRDLLGLLALSLVWRSRDPSGILESLLEALESCLPIAFAHARIPVSFGGSLDVARAGGRPIGVDQPAWTTLIDEFAAGRTESVDTPLGTMRSVYLPFGYHGARGRLVVASRSQGFPSAAQSVLLRTAACLADAAVETAMLFEDLRREREFLETRVAERTQDRQRLLLRLVESQEQERARIARDLHDHVGQQISALRFVLDTVSVRGGLPPQTAGELQALVRGLDADIDALARGLRPASLDDLGLVSALTTFIDQWSRQCGVPCRFHALGLEERLSPDIETNVFRIVQEALNNAAKHSRAHRLAVVVERRRDDVVLVIEDDGVGFDESAVSDGVGLLGMRERAALLGGSLLVESSVGRGTSVFLRCPVTPSDREAE